MSPFAALPSTTFLDDYYNAKIRSHEGTICLFRTEVVSIPLSINVNWWRQAVGNCSRWGNLSNVCSKIQLGCWVFEASSCPWASIWADCYTSPPELSSSKSFWKTSNGPTITTVCRCARHNCGGRTWNVSLIVRFIQLRLIFDRLQTKVRPFWCCGRYSNTHPSQFAYMAAYSVVLYDHLLTLDVEVLNHRIPFSLYHLTLDSE